MREEELTGEVGSHRPFFRGCISAEGEQDTIREPETAVGETTDPGLVLRVETGRWEEREASRPPLRSLTWVTGRWSCNKASKRTQGKLELGWEKPELSSAGHGR